MLVSKDSEEAYACSVYEMTPKAKVSDRQKDLAVKSIALDLEVL